MILGMIFIMIVCIVFGFIMSYNLSMVYVLGFLMGVFISGIISFLF